MPGVNDTPRSTSPNPAARTVAERSPRPGSGGRAEVVGDGDEAVGVGADVGGAADGRGDRPDGRSPVRVDMPGDVAQAVGGRSRQGRAVTALDPGGITGHGVGLAEVEAALEGVGQSPGVLVQGQDPLLQAGGGLAAAAGVNLAEVGS